MQEPTHRQSKKQEGLKVSETQGRLPGRRQSGACFSSLSVARGVLLWPQRVCVSMCISCMCMHVYACVCISTMHA